MTGDYQEEISGQPTPIEKELAATDALADLRNQIAELPMGEIDPDSAVYIAGQLLGRTIEERYLLAPAFENPDERSNRDIELNNIQTRKETGLLQNTLREAMKGEFGKLKEFIVEQAEDMEGWARGGDIEYQNTCKETSAKLRFINEKIPLNGNGSIIKVPNPSWMEKPAPLKIQLQLMESGGEIRR